MQPPDFSRLYPDQRAAGATPLRQCQLVMIRMLKIMDHICGSEGISYWMTAGTLIGALRHGGMIPWDCDIDVAMTEEDADAFHKVAAKLPPDIFFQTPVTDPAYRLDIMFKLRDRYSNYTEWGSNNPDATWHNGLQVDIIIYRRNESGHLVNPFRQTQLSAPCNADSYIRRRYGDYLQLPPAEARIPHEGVADPFTPCKHPEARPYPFPRC
jgi:phosphorylcholine metabolism protein LicD